MTGSWHLVTGEYPPQPGGVSDYTSGLARALADSGLNVHVWAPAIERHAATAPAPGVTVHRLDDEFGERGLSALDDGLDAAPEPRTVLVQYVPHAYGMRGMNVRFCRWVQTRARARRDDVRVMFHEPYYPFAFWPLHRNLLALANRIMAVLLLSDIRLAYVSTTAWQRRLSKYAPRARRFVWLPIPSSIPAAPATAAVAEWRRHFSGETGAAVVGHFGTFGSLVARSLAPALALVLARRTDVRVALIGPGGGAFADRLCARRTDWRGRITVTERLDAAEVAAALKGCDLVLQPYADGASGRRTTLMAGLVNGIAVVTNRGAATEAVWAEAGAVEFAAASHPAALGDAVARLLDDEELRVRRAAAGAELYARHFAMQRTVAALVATEEPGS